MTSYEQYVDVVEHIKTVWVTTPVFVKDEPIEVDPPYLVVQSYGISNTTLNCGNIREDQRGYELFCYAAHRGKAEKLVSDVLDALNNTRTTSGLDVCGLEYAEPIAKMENGIFEAVIRFTVKSHKID